MPEELTKDPNMITAAAFIRKLVGLGIKASLNSIESGPVVTAFKFKLDHSVPIAKIINKSEDFALAADAEKVSIQRIGGEIVIFAANKERKLVEFKDYLTWFMTDDKVASMSLPIGLGVDYLGNKTAIDLQEMPHILLAGETGSGKSVFQAALVSCLSVFREASEMRLNFIDTKQLDLPLFSQLPHVDSVVTKLDEFYTFSDSLLRETRRRMERLKGCSVRNIGEFHKMMGSISSMPFIVTVIDEFGDLLAQDKQARKEDKEKYEDKMPVEKWLQTIVQIARAAGVHVIAGTQRTSVKIINGDIKANFPCRISLRLPTGFDSRTILGTEGAENLLGKGDMLIQMPDSEVLRRYHGPFVNLNDIAWITSESDYVRSMYHNVRNQQNAVNE